MIWSFAFKFCNVKMLIRWKKMIACVEYVSSSIRHLKMMIKYYKYKSECSFSMIQIHFSSEYSTVSAERCLTSCFEFFDRILNCVHWSVKDWLNAFLTFFFFFNFSWNFDASILISKSCAHIIAMYKSSCLRSLL